MTADRAGEGTTTLDGFLIVGGQADGPDRLSVGGGLLRKDADLDIRRCVFRDNTALRGGAIAVGQCTLLRCDTEMRLTGCTFEKNAARDFGGALASFANGGTVVVDGCVFRGNRCPWGRDVSSTAGDRFNINGCNFYSDAPDASGSAVYLSDDFRADFRACTFRDYRNGGAIGSAGGVGTVLDCDFIHNGWGISVPVRAASADSSVAVFRATALGCLSP